MTRKTERYIRYVVPLFYWFLPLFIPFGGAAVPFVFVLSVSVSVHVAQHRFSATCETYKFRLMSVV